jgi:hypothetical protein
MATHHRPTTADELLDAAGALERDARAARHETLEAYARAGISGRGGDDAATRNRLAAQAGADEAARQVEMATGAREMHRSTRDLEVEAAAAARADGKFAAALEHDEAAQIAGAKLRIAEHQLQEATRAMWAQREEVDRWTPIDDEVLRHADREIERQRLEDVFDTQERRAVDYRNAAADLREAERLEAALPDLEARRVAGCVERACAMPPPSTRGRPPPQPSGGARWAGRSGTEPDEIEMPPMDMRPGSQGPVGATTAEPTRSRCRRWTCGPGHRTAPSTGRSSTRASC